MHSGLAGAGLSLDPVADYRQLTAFPFMVHALEAGTVVAVMAAVVGWFMVLRRESFAGHTLSVLAFPGAAGAAQRLTANPYRGLAVSGALALVAMWSGLIVSDLVPSLPASAAVIGAATMLYLGAFLLERAGVTEVRTRLG
ncbi:MAG: metal ABC transporter permease [Solirubrobacterales bacterium]|nr:metal ABC transporter permease [Solirubrobacterales bacterium]MBV9717562.1 metal ABC transporter permease [Solirubrobacterales bacterium]